MYHCRVRDRVMIAHSFKGEVFGPAQKLHGATFVVDVEFRRAELDENNIVIDIGRALGALHEILAAINYQNLDQIESFEGQNTTTEFVARYVFDAMKARLARGELGPGSDAISHLRVEIAESDVAWAGFEAALP